MTFRLLMKNHDSLQPQVRSQHSDVPTAFSRDLHLRPAAVLVRHRGRGADRGHRRPVDVLHGLRLRRRDGSITDNLVRLPVHYHGAGLLPDGVAVRRRRRRYRHRRQRRVERRLRAGERVGHCLDGRLRGAVRVGRSAWIKDGPTGLRPDMRLIDTQLRFQIAAQYQIAGDYCI